MKLLPLRDYIRLIVIASLQHVCSDLIMSDLCLTYSLPSIGCAAACRSQNGHLLRLSMANVHSMTRPSLHLSLYWMVNVEIIA
jgi:hypothetical protein